MCNYIKFYIINKRVYYKFFYLYYYSIIQLIIEILQN